MSAPVGRSPAACRILLAALLGFVPIGASAATIEDAMASAYAHDPALQSARWDLSQTDELVPQAKSLWLPNVQVSVGGGYVQGKGVVPTGGAQIRQPLYDPRAEGKLSEAEGEVAAKRAKLMAVEGDVLLKAATSYLDLVRAGVVARANEQHAAVLERELASAKRRLSAGELRPIDVSDVETRLAAADAQRIQAEGALAVAKTTYAETVGLEAGAVVMPPVPGDLPQTMDEARALSVDNPAVIAAAYAQTAAESGVDAAKGAMRPSVQARADIVFQRSDVLGEVVWPLYDGGLSRSQVRTAKDAVQQRHFDRENQERTARQQAMAAFQALQTARASIVAYQTQLRTATATAAGIRRERGQGLRTIDEVLDADVQVTNAQVSLIGAERDARVAAYQLLAAVGRLDAKSLKLPVSLYDPEAHYRAVRNDFWTTGLPQSADGQGR